MKRLLVAVMTALLLGGCTVDGGNADGDSWSQGNPSVQATHVPNAGPACSASMENCYSRSQMNYYAQAITEIVSSYFSKQFPNLAEPHITYVPHGVAGPEPCTDREGTSGSFTSESYEYCPADQTIYLGQDALWTLYRLDDAAPAAGLAHEWTHHIQQAANVPAPETAQQSVVLEDQADCGSGSWFAAAVQSGQADQDDLHDIGKYLAAIGSAESPDRDHGTTGERQQAFARGYHSSIAGCSAYFPNTPLVA